MGEWSVTRTTEIAVHCEECLYSLHGSAYTILIAVCSYTVVGIQGENCATSLESITSSRSQIRP